VSVKDLLNRRNQPIAPPAREAQRAATTTVRRMPPTAQ
jgi:hypothetical protein